MSGLSDLYDYSIHDLDALLALEGYALRVVHLSPSHPAERKESSPCVFDVPAGLGDQLEIEV